MSAKDVLLKFLKKYDLTFSFSYVQCIYWILCPTITKKLNNDLCCTQLADTGTHIHNKEISTMSESCQKVQSQPLCKIKHAFDLYGM